MITTHYKLNTSKFYTVIKMPMASPGWGFWSRVTKCSQLLCNLRALSTLDPVSLSQSDMLRLSIPPREQSSLLAHLHQKTKAPLGDANVFNGGDGGFRTPVQMIFRRGSTKLSLFFCFQHERFKANKILSHLSSMFFS